MLVQTDRLRRLALQRGHRGAGWRALSHATSAIEAGALAVRGLGLALSATERGLGLPGFTRDELRADVPTDLAGPVQL